MSHSRGESSNVTNCVARHAGAGNLIYCVTEHGAHCDHALPFGEVFFCRHPEAAEIAARTAASARLPADG